MTPATKTLLERLVATDRGFTKERGVDHDVAMRNLSRGWVERSILPSGKVRWQITAAGRRALAGFTMK